MKGSIRFHFALWLHVSFNVSAIWHQLTKVSLFAFLSIQRCIVYIAGVCFLLLELCRRLSIKCRGCWACIEICLNFYADFTGLVPRVARVLGAKVTGLAPRVAQVLGAGVASLVSRVVRV